MINSERLTESLRSLAKMGAFLDESTGLMGVNRLALTDNDKLGRDLVVSWFKEAGLEVTVDKIGNVFGRRAGRNNHLKPVMSGSHIDSVPTGGAFDGVLGVLGALEVIRTLNDLNLVTERPLVVAFFTEEEGARFGTDMCGSAVATNRISLETAYALKDKDGLTIKSELERIGYLGEGEVPWEAPHAYVECHIEQGPIIRSKNLDIGVVTGVQGIKWMKLEIRGKSGHAGATPIDLRADAGLAAAKINLKIREMALSGQYGPQMRATMGAIYPHPGLINIVPGRLGCTVDLRNPDDECMERAFNDLLEYFSVVEQEEKVKITWQITAQTPRIAFDPSVMQLIASVADGLGLSHEEIVSGAGHDAQEMSHVCKTAMIFVPGEFEGISHNVREYSTPKQCSDGVNVLFHTLITLANEL